MDGSNTSDSSILSVASLLLKDAHDDTRKVSERHHRALPALNFRGDQSFVKFLIGDGDKKETFLLQKSVVIAQSPFFEAAFNNTTFTEGQSQTMMIEDIEPDRFELVANWLFARDVYPQATKEVKKVADISPLELAKCWTLAERFLMPKLQNHVMSILCNLLECDGRKGRPYCWEDEGWEDFLHYAYREDVVQENKLMKLALNATMRDARLLLEEFQELAAASRGEAFDKIKQNIPDRMMADVARGLFILVGDFSWTEIYCLVGLNDYLVEE